MKTTNPRHPAPQATFSNRAFSEATDDHGFPMRKSLRRIAGTGTFTAAPRHRHAPRPAAQTPASSKKPA